MKKVITLIVLVAMIATLGITAAFAGTQKYVDLDLTYDIKFMITNGEASQVEKGGQAGIGDKTAAKDEVIKVFSSWVGYPEKTIEKIGVILNPDGDESAPIWYVNNPEITTSEGIVEAAGDKAVVFEFDVDTSAFPEGKHTMIFVAQVDGEIMSIGYQTNNFVVEKYGQDYGDECFTVAVESSGANYDPNAGQQEEPQEEPKEEPKEEPQEEPQEEPKEEPKTTGDVSVFVAVIAVVALAVVVLKKRENA